MILPIRYLGAAMAGAIAAAGVMHAYRGEIAWAVAAAGCAAFGLRIALRGNP